MKFYVESMLLLVLVPVQYIRKIQLLELFGNWEQF